MAVVIPHEAHLRSFLSGKGIDSTRDLETLCADPAIKDIVLKECNAVGKKNGFKPAELLQAVVLTHEEWTPENGLVTAAQKIQRAKIAKTFRSEIDVSPPSIHESPYQDLTAIDHRLSTRLVNCPCLLGAHPFHKHFILMSAIFLGFYNILISRSITTSMNQ